MEGGAASKGGGSEYITWDHSGGIWMPESEAAKRCIITRGFDQPAEYNIGHAISVRYSYQCCNECAKNLPGSSIPLKTVEFVTSLQIVGLQSEFTFVFPQKRIQT